MAEILGPDIEICAFVIEGKKKVFAKAQRSTELSKQKKGWVHQSPLLTTGRRHSKCQHHTDLSGLPVRFLITLLISKQTKLRGSFIFSFLNNVFLFSFLHLNCALLLPGTSSKELKVFQVSRTWAEFEELWKLEVKMVSHGLRDK